MSFFRSLALFIIVCVLFTSCNTSSDQANEKNQKIESEIPDLIITTSQGIQLDLKKNQGKAVIFMFQPECDDCQREAVEIRENIKGFDGYMVYFISSAPMPQITGFANQYKLSNYDNVVFAQTTVQNIINTLGPIPAPSLYIYSDEGKLVKSFNKEVNFNDIKNYL